MLIDCYILENCASRDSLPYRICTPEKYSLNRRYPLVLYLHVGPATGENPAPAAGWGGGFRAGGCSKTRENHSPPGPLSLERGGNTKCGDALLVVYIPTERLE